MSSLARAKATDLADAREALDLMTRMYQEATFKVHQMRGRQNRLRYTLEGMVEDEEGVDDYAKGVRAGWNTGVLAAAALVKELEAE